MNVLIEKVWFWSTVQEIANYPRGKLLLENLEKYFPVEFKGFNSIGNNELIEIL